MQHAMEELHLLEASSASCGSELYRPAKGPRCKWRGALLAGALAGAGLVGTCCVRSARSAPLHQAAPSITAGGGLGLAQKIGPTPTQLQDPEGRCLVSRKVHEGRRELLLGICNRSANDQFFVIQGSTIQSYSEEHTLLCMTQEELEVLQLVGLDVVFSKTPVFLEPCRPGYTRQVFASHCLFGEGDRNNTPAFVKHCDLGQGINFPVHGASLFCFMAILPNSGEVTLRDAAEARGASIFGCEAHKVYESWPTGTYHTAEGEFSANADVFLRVWQQVFEDAIYKSHDWTVKVDPDCVWLPERLRTRLLALDTHVSEPVFVKNTELRFGFLSPIEVLSQGAVLKLAALDLAEHCPPPANTGEDLWLFTCMKDHAGIGWKEDLRLLEDNTQVGACGHGSYVAYHYHKDPASWNACMDDATNLASERVSLARLHPLSQDPFSLS